MKRIKPVYPVIFILLAAMAGIIGYKIFALKLKLENLIPRISYTVELFMSFSGNGNDVRLLTFLPENSDTQRISDEKMSALQFDFTKETAPLYTRGEWKKSKATRPHKIIYSFNVQLAPIRCTIEKGYRQELSYPEELNAYLTPTDMIQSDDPLISELAGKLAVDTADMYQLLKNVFDYVYGLGRRSFVGTTDAVTAAKRGEAGCNGKSRLFVAIMRNLKIPSRLVGGIILNPGIKQTTHQWLEIYISGQWVPFDALNNHFAELPDNYLVLYRGDESLFVHSGHISFDYCYTIKTPDMADILLPGNHAFNLSTILSTFRQMHLSTNILTFLLTIPLGALVVVIFRNIIGIRTFGTFLPALMAVAARETGLILGIAGFIFTIGVCIIIRYLLEKLKILHTPKLAILMVAVISSLLFLTMLSNIIRINGFSLIGAVSLFPIAILTITAERFAITIDENGFLEAIKIMGWTLLVTCACYAVMHIPIIETLMLAFPELLLGIIAVNLLIGSWTGLRISELIRFRVMYIKKGSTKIARTDEKKKKQ